jgi:polysaccharide deacetylase 2 family uncharacterized protein YibQ
MQQSGSTGRWIAAVATLLGCGLLLTAFSAPVPSPASAPAPQEVALTSITVAQGGEPVALDLSPAVISQLRAKLDEKGTKLEVTDDGLVEVPQSKAAVKAVDAAPLPDVALPPRPDRPMIAVVIDDIGVVRERSERAIALPKAITLAFLPYGEGVADMAARAKARGHEVMLHLPMQPKSSSTNPGPNAMLLGLSDDELARRLEWNLSQFSGFTGVNNHMGSAFTEDAAGMAKIMASLHARGLFFLDSVTTEHSAARRIAYDQSIRFAERDVFLDNHQDASYVALQLAELEERARRTGSAIAIGHPHAETLAVLARWLPSLEARGFQLVTVQTVIEARKTPLWRLAQNRAPRQGG